VVLLIEIFEGDFKNSFRQP